VQSRNIADQATSTARRPVEVNDGELIAPTAVNDAIRRTHAKLDHIVIDRGEQVKADAEAIKLLAKRASFVAFVNNHVAGSAPEALRQVAALLGQEHLSQTRSPAVGGGPSPRPKGTARQTRAKRPRMR
jgi:hypothetical protein